MKHEILKASLAIIFLLFIAGTTIGYLGYFMNDDSELVDKRWKLILIFLPMGYLLVWFLNQWEDLGIGGQMKYKVIDTRNNEDVTDLDNWVLYPSGDLCTYDTDGLIEYAPEFFEAVADDEQMEDK